MKTLSRSALFCGHASRLVVFPFYIDHFPTPPFDLANRTPILNFYFRDCLFPLQPSCSRRTILTSLLFSPQPLSLYFRSFTIFFNFVSFPFKELSVNPSQQHFFRVFRIPFSVDLLEAPYPLWLCSSFFFFPPFYTLFSLFFNFVFLFSGDRTLAGLLSPAHHLFFPPPKAFGIINPSLLRQQARAPRPPFTGANFLVSFGKPFQSRHLWPGQNVRISLVRFLPVRIPIFLFPHFFPPKRAFLLSPFQIVRESEFFYVLYHFSSPPS